MKLVTGAVWVETANNPALVVQVLAVLSRNGQDFPPILPVSGKYYWIELDVQPSGGIVSRGMSGGYRVRRPVVLELLLGMLGPSGWEGQNEQREREFRPKLDQQRKRREKIAADGTIRPVLIKTRKEKLFYTN